MGNIFSFFESKKFIISAVIIFLLFFILGYIIQTNVSYSEKWFGAGATFWSALRPF